MLTTPQITIAFVPREQFGTTRRSLETLYENTPEPFELICVDGGSPPAVRDFLRAESATKGFTLLRSDTYLSPNQARNAAIARVRTPYVVFVDNDVLVSPGWLRPLVDCAVETQASIVAPLYLEFEPPRQQIHMFGGQCAITEAEHGGHEYFERHHMAHTQFSGAAVPLERTETELVEFHTVLVDMNVFRRLGPLDEGLLCNTEHGDLCLTVRNAGGRIFLEPHSRITWMPPERLDRADREFFGLRWSEAWCDATNRHLQRKWKLPPESAGLALAKHWVRTHRRHFGLPRIIRACRLLPHWLTDWLENQLIIPWETASNRRRYPAAKFGTVAPPRLEAFLGSAT